MSLTHYLKSLFSNRFIQYILYYDIKNISFHIEHKAFLILINEFFKI